MIKSAVVCGTRLYVLTRALHEATNLWTAQVCAGNTNTEEPIVDSTSISLLARVREPGDTEAWTRFVELYAPLIYFWAGKHGLNAADAADLVQDVLATLVVRLPEFKYDRNLRFRGWLHTITLNRARDWHRRRPQEPVDELSVFVETLADDADCDVFEEDEYRRFIVQRIREIMQLEFEESTWKAFWLNVAEGKSATEVSREIGISENAVRVAKYRVVKRLRAEFEGMIP